VVVVVKLGLILFPVPARVPPVKAVYQFMVPAEAVALSVTVPVPHRELGVVPVIIPEGFTATVSVDDPGLVPQPFPAVTLIVPPAEPAVAVIVVVPAPAVIVHPAGTVQLYDVASVTAAIL
jgi:hypothetical protein